MSATELTEDDALATLNQYVVERDGQQRIEVEVDGRQNTVKVRPVYEFERDLLDRLIETSLDGSVSGAAVPIKGRWINGWLNVQGEDYINNIWHGYQFFLRYVQVETSKIGNIQTHKRAPGTYESMYRYLLMLEDLDLIDRHRRQAVDADEYDHNVPEEFRTRTYIILQASLEDNERLWDNPQEALYGGEDQEVEQDVEQDIEEDEPTTIGGFDIEPEGEATEQEDGGPTETAGDFIEDEADQEPDVVETQEEGYDLPDVNASIEDFPDRELLPPFVANHLDDAIRQAYEESPVPAIESQPSDFDFYQIAIVGPWANGEATPGQTTLDIFVGVDNRDADTSPGFVLPGVNRILPRLLNQNNQFEEVFPSYNIQSTYSSSFMQELRSYIQSTQETDLFYSFRSNSIDTV